MVLPASAEVQLYTADKTIIGTKAIETLSAKFTATTLVLLQQAPSQVTVTDIILLLIVIIIIIIVIIIIIIIIIIWRQKPG